MKNEAFGWGSAEAPGKFLVQGDSNGLFSAFRTWTSDGTFALAPRPGMICAVLVLDGASDGSYEGQKGEYRANELVLFDGEAAAAVETREPSIRVGWWVSPTILGGKAFRGLMGQPVPVSSAGRVAALALTDALLGVEGSVANPYARRAYSQSLEHLISGLLHERRLVRNPAVSRAEELLLEAQSLIEERFRDSGFNVVELARLMHVSPPTLHRPYGDLGTSPRREIERRRLSEARAYLAMGISNPRLMTVAAEASGFRSVRQLKQALARAENQGRPAEP
ncbi:hypothetical protein [Arthrobacter sp. NPDC090010]|uniref:hypothetical protein n=1 Tax=Arthrobacter sp. NPDC090010 TaxID=3363942 RepID=UPI0037FB49FC